jgi:catechol 2,3-dioxygenase-like lactoylglutathione lyase family enzyme
MRTAWRTIAIVPGIDHVAVESPDPDRAAAFYERLLGARVVKTEGHPVMAYFRTGALAFHRPDGPDQHTGFRVSEQERAELAQRLDAEGIQHEEHDHGVAVGLFFRDPDGRLVEAITYRSGDDPRRR